MSGTLEPLPIALSRVSLFDILTTLTVIAPPPTKSTKILCWAYQPFIGGTVMSSEATPEPSRSMIEGLGALFKTWPPQLAQNWPSRQATDEPQKARRALV